ncbi:membrane protein [Corynebacterium phocae]|uniref:Membrane protein n=1 Tax=Corynebacterium phocae TaxID=161895 RepID=A0A1L7D250_9CORY|nr:DUF4191 domain-containing protein [Corynebacterium phocae]APT92188.1 membrane protein [Corynebacterium phocae]KAA8725766.1 DUF4191 domain-containing protein [Corynebacterium phocae]
MAKGEDKAVLRTAKKEERAAKRKRNKEARSQMWQAFNIQRKQDKALVPLMLLAIIGVALAFFLIGLLFGGQWFMLILGLGVGFVLAMFIFTRRLERDMYKKVEDQPGVAGWALQQQLKNTMGIVWDVKPGVAATRQQDMIHRVIGNSGVILVGEGNQRRLQPTLKQLKARIDRIAGGVPVYEVYVGDGEDQVPLTKLRTHIMKLPRNFKKDETLANIKKITAMDNMPGANPGLPKGPMPRQAQNMAGMNRRMRRAAERNK